MILLNGDLPLEIQPLKGTSQVVSRPVQDLSCKWPGFAYTLFHSASLHLFPTSPCYWNKHPNCRSDSVCTWGTSETDYTQSAAKCTK